MITYTWRVKQIKARNEGPFEKAVVQTYWEKIGTDEDGNTGRFSGATPFSAENVSEGDFVPFEQLTEEIVLSWIQSQVTGEYEKHVNERILKQIEDAKNPIVEPDLPWAPAQPEVSESSVSGSLIS